MKQNRKKIAPFLIIFLLAINFINNFANFVSIPTTEALAKGLLAEGKLPVAQELQKLSVVQELQKLPAAQESQESQPLPELTLYAKSAVLMDADSGRVLYEKNGYEKLANASTTKIMTCIIALENGKMDDAVTISSYAASMPKVRLGMKAGDTFSLKDLLYSLMLESHNDSAAAIAEHVGGSVEGFAAKMNQKAKELGCKDTYFITPNGLDATDENGQHGTSGADLATMMRYCIQNETFLEITRTASYSFSNIEKTRNYSCNNHNAFLSMMEGALSGKTGFTGNAGYCYIGALRQGERTFIVALLACGWPNNKTYKWADAKQLMKYGLDHYRYEDIFEHDKELSDILVTEAIPQTGKLYDATMLKPTIHDQNLNILINPTEKIKSVYDIPHVLEAPVEAGQTVGTVSYFLNEEKIAQFPVYVMKSVKKLNWKWYFDYIMDGFALYKQSL
ncbi:D-alanyl-D-alanine carboxypeptidase [Lachnospiraceae bacterium ZAX-1]